MDFWQKLDACSSIPFLLPHASSSHHVPDLHLPSVPTRSLSRFPDPSVPSFGYLTPLSQGRIILADAVYIHPLTQSLRLRTAHSVKNARPPLPVLLECGKRPP